MLISKFLEYLSVEKKYAQKTIESYQNDLEDFRRFLLTESTIKGVSEAEKTDIRNFLMHLSQSGLSERSINRKISVLNTFFKYLLKIGEIELSPTTGIHTLKHYNKVQVPLAEEEIQRLFDTPNLFPDDFIGKRDRMIIDLFYQTGMRRAELIQLKMDDVDLMQRQIRIMGKGGKERLVPIGENLLESITLYIKERKLAYPENSAELFLTEKGKAFSDKLVYNIVNHYLSLVSSKQKTSPHILRHSFATHLLNHGADLNSIKALLGHSSLAATQVYTNVNIDQLKTVFNQAHPRSEKSKRNEH
ncbi:MAG: tyrosine-type recombinase/integrase [Weeksellaceae bacterium]